MKKAIISSASNKFFPSLINLLGSLHTNYPNHPDVFIYDLRLTYSYRKELEKISWVHVLKIPRFVPYWRACYTWKTHILNTPLAELNLYLDAGCQVLQPLDTLFDSIDEKDYLLVSQGKDIHTKQVTPVDYVDIFGLSTDLLKNEVITAGIFGFKKESSISPITLELYNCGVSGLCLGFSQGEMWKNKGVNKTPFVRNCPMFRHDTTLLTILALKRIENPTIQPVDSFASILHNDGKQLIWNMRLNFNTLSYIRPRILHITTSPVVLFNRTIIKIFFILKKINTFLVK